MFNFTMHGTCLKLGNDKQHPHHVDKLGDARWNTKNCHGTTNCHGIPTSDLYSGSISLRLIKWFGGENGNPQKCPYRANSFCMTVGRPPGYCTCAKLILKHCKSNGMETARCHFYTFKVPKGGSREVGAVFWWHFWTRGGRITTDNWNQ